LIRSLSISTKRPRRAQFSRGWRQAVGIRRPSPCGGLVVESELEPAGGIVGAAFDDTERPGNEPAATN